MSETKTEELTDTATPRTDAFEMANFPSGEEEFSGRDIDKTLDFARELERELQTALSQREEAKEQMELLQDQLHQIREACPACRRQHLLDASPLDVVKAQLEYMNWAYDSFRQAEAQREEAVRENERLKTRVGESEDFMAFMEGELAKFPCCHESGEHEGTPPMMWPELIGCIVKRATESLRQQLALSESANAARIEAGWTFRDSVLNQRGQLEAPCLDNDQTNAVLGLYDDVMMTIAELTPGQSLLDRLAKAEAGLQNQRTNYEHLLATQATAKFAIGQQVAALREALEKLNAAAADAVTWCDDDEPYKVKFMAALVASFEALASTPSPSIEVKDIHAELWRKEKEAYLAGGDIECSAGGLVWRPCVSPPDAWPLAWLYRIKPDTSSFVPREVADGLADELEEEQMGHNGAGVMSPILKTYRATTKEKV